MCHEHIRETGGSRQHFVSTTCDTLVGQRHPVTPDYVRISTVLPLMINQTRLCHHDGVQREIDVDYPNKWCALTLALVYLSSYQRLWDEAILVLSSIEQCQSRIHGMDSFYFSRCVCMSI